MDSKTPQNTAAYLTASSSKTKTLEVGPAPYPSTLPANTILIKNGAVAMNPIDCLLQENPGMVFPWLKLPFVIGSDVAGTVISIGSAVSRFKPGDRVVGQARGMLKERNNAAEGAFQTYTVLLEDMTSQIPDGLGFENAAVLPLGLSTAVSGLFLKDQLGLQLPMSPKRERTGKTVLVWGGSTSVGSNAIQLAVAAGYEVITTSSPKNFEYVKKLGAAQAFDYNSPTVIPDIIRAFKGKQSAGALSIGHGAAEACFDILNQCSGNKFIAMASYPVPSPPPKSFVLLTIISYWVSRSILYWVRSKTRVIGYKLVAGDELVKNGIGRAIYRDFLPAALQKGTFVAAPEPLVVGKGLEYVQEGLDLMRKGVSAKKIVVSL